MRQNTDNSISNCTLTLKVLFYVKCTPRPSFRQIYFPLILPGGAAGNETIGRAITLNLDGGDAGIVRRGGGRQHRGS